MQKSYFTFKKILFVHYFKGIDWFVLLLLFFGGFFTAY